MDGEALVTLARLQYERTGIIDTSLHSRLSEEGYVVDELLESFEGETHGG